MNVGLLDDASRKYIFITGLQQFQNGLVCIVYDWKILIVLAPLIPETEKQLTCHSFINLHILYMF